MTTTVFTTQTIDSDGNVREYATTLAGMARDIANGTATIKKYAVMGDSSGLVGLYLPNHKTFWITFVDSINGNDPSWNQGFYCVVALGTPEYDEAREVMHDKTQIHYSALWSSSGNSYGLITEYLKAYLGELGEVDDYWTE